MKKGKSKIFLFLNFQLFETIYFPLFATDMACNHPQEEDQAHTESVTVLSWSAPNKGQSSDNVIIISIYTNSVI